MGNLRAILPILLSLVIAVGGSFFLYRWIQTQTGPEQTVTITKVEATPVVVAVQDIPLGTRITAEMLTQKPFLKESLPPGYFGKTEDVVSRIPMVALKAGDPVVEHRLASSNIKTGGVSAVVKAGYRAIAVRGNKVIGISGFINPGNRVDVLVTIKDPQRKKEISKTVLENILVLASGTEIQEGKSGTPSPVDVYTLEVTPEDAEKLVLAATEGKLQFALRNALDNNAVKTQGITISELLSSLPPKSQPPEVAGPSPTPPKKKVRRVWRRSPAFVAENIRGIQVTKQKFTIN